MNTIINIFLYLNLALISYYIGNGIALKWKIGYKLRSKYAIFNRKPFNCLCCLTFWLFLISTMLIFPELLILNIANALVIYFLARYFEEYIQ